MAQIRATAAWYRWFLRQTKARQRAALAKLEKGYFGDLDPKSGKPVYTPLYNNRITRLR